jgi:hypothetical protein
VPVPYEAQAFQPGRREAQLQPGRFAQPLGLARHAMHLAEAPIAVRQALCMAISPSSREA